MPVGRNSVYGPAHAPVYDPAPIHGKRRVYVTGGAFDLPPFHQAGFVTQFGIEALSVGYPAPVDLVLTSATVTLRATGGGSVTFVINVNGVPTESRTVFTAGLTVYPLEVTLAPGDVVTSEVTDTTGDPEDFLVVLRAEVIECPIYSWVYIVNSAPADGQIVPNLGSAPDADLVVNNLGANDWSLGSTDGRTPVGAVCDPALPWTALIRVGDFAAAYATITGPTDGRAISGEWVTPDGANNALWTFSQSTGGDGLDLFEVIDGLAASGALSPASPISDITFMISATPPAVGGTVSDYRAVTIEGPVADHVITDLSLTGELYSPGAGIVPFIQLTNVPFSQGVNGLGLWRERCTTDAEFLAKYADFAPRAKPTFRSSTSILSNLTATLTPPAGVQTGDLLVLCAMRRVSHLVTTNDPFISSTGGQTWIEVGQNFNSGYSLRVWSAIAAGTLTNVVIAGTETFSGAATCNAALLVFKAGTFDPRRFGGVGPPGVQIALAGSGFSAFNAGTLSPTVTDSLRLMVAGARRNGVSVYGPMTVDTGWTMREALNAATGLGNNSGMVVAEKATPLAGLTPSPDTVTEGGGAFIQTFHLAIYPP